MTVPEEHSPRPLRLKIYDFNRRVEALILSHGHAPAPALGDATRWGLLLCWLDYEALLGHRSVDAQPDSDLRVRWGELNVAVQEEKRALQREALAIPASELRATTVAEFVALLRRLRRRARGGVTGLSQRSGIGRSQIYAITNPHKPILPTRSEQVRAFLEACDLPERQIVVAEQLWVDLKEARSEDASLLGEQKLLTELHRVMIELAGMTDQAHRVQAPTGRALVAAAVEQLPPGALANPGMVAAVLEEAARVVRVRAASTRRPRSTSGRLSLSHSA